MKVRVYRNLSRNCWSVQDVKTGKVIAHRPAVTLTQAEFVVRQAGRERVLREGKKYVHAFVVGNMLFDTRAVEGLRRNGPLQVGYNPFKAPTFVTKPFGNPIKTAPRVRLDVDGKVWAG